MTYQEIKHRLTQCELALKNYKSKNNSYKPEEVSKIKKLELLKESLTKLLNEAQEKTYLVTPKSGKRTAISLGDDEVDALKDADDVDKIKSIEGDDIKEQDGVKFSVEETKSIAKRVGKAVAQALKSLGDEVAHMKAKNIEENSFEIYVQYKNESDDQFSFYVVDDTLHLVDFSFDKELTDVGVKPSGEAVVNVDVLANELVKHFKSLNETEISEAPEGMFYIKVAVRDARKALAIIDDSPAYSKAVEMDGSDTYYLTDEELAYDLLMDFGAHDIEVTDNNIEMDEATDYAKRRAAERDYQPSKRDVPPKKYKEPSNDYFARRKAEMEEGDVDAEMDGGDLDVGHQDDEPNMLKKDLYDVITYAAKLYKQLDKYDQHDGEIDFPHWWQKKVTLAREYMSAAQHYLEGEEKQPAIDQLALENASSEEEEKFHKKLDTLVHNTFGKRKEEMDENRFLAASMEDLEQVIRNLAHTGEMSEDEAIELAIRKLEAMLDGRDDMDEGIAKTQKAHSLVVAKMKELAKQYKAGDKSVVAQLKDLTAKKKQLEKQLEKDVAGKNRGQQLDTGINEGRGDLEEITSIIEDRANESGFDVQDEAIEVIEAIADHYELGEVQFEYQNEAQLNEQATCCGKCGRVHVKGTKCKTPYLKGKDHCRTK